LEDFGTEYIPVIDYYGFYLRGGEHKTETDNMLEETYKDCRKLIDILRRELKMSFQVTA